MKPRAWSDPTGCSSTTVLYYPRGVIYMLTNMGWVGPMNLELEEGETVEQAAEKIAKGYELEEVSEERARWLAGEENGDASDH